MRRFHITLALSAALLALLVVSPARAQSPQLQDTALVVGTLPNGMRYYLRANRAPAHRAEFRLAVNAGSLLEDEDQRGYAHFVEHMAFNGTTHFPRNSLIDFIETSGMRFGADLNAYTSQDETVYMFTLPTDDPALVDHGLQVLEDWASGGITIDSSEVIAERGVIMGEWRMRLADTASQTIQKHYDPLWFGDSRYPEREPIGDTTLIETAQPAPIRRFYHDWYRPDLMAIVVVGDFDAAAMRREIERRFGRIPARKHARRRPQPVVKLHDVPEIDVYRGKVTPSVEVAWPVLPEATSVTERYRQQLTNYLLHQDLQRRLREIRERPSRPFITADVEQGRVVRPVEVTGFSLIAWPDSLERGLGAVLTEIARLSQHGPGEAVLAQDKAELLRGLESSAASELARSSGSYADAYVGNYLRGDGPLLGADQELALARQILPSITPEVLADAARRLWSTRGGERVFVRLPLYAHVRPPTPKEVRALFDSVARTPVAPDSARAYAESPLLDHPPTPGRISAERRDTVAGITEWTLSNGARVIVKPSANDQDELLVRAWSPGGFSLLPDSLFFTPGRMVARMMTEAAGLGGHDHDALHQQFRATGIRDLRVNIGYADESIDLAGSPRELETLFQALYLQFTAPTLDTAAVHSWASLAKWRGTPFSFDDWLDQIFARGEPRLAPIGTELAELAKPSDAMAVYRNRFGSAGDFTFTLVGAITPEQVRPFVERYIASLPSTAEHEEPKRIDVVPFLHNVDDVSRVLEQPKAVTELVFDGPLPSDPARYLEARRELGALATVVQDRVRTRLREELSGTYSPAVMARTYSLPDDSLTTEHYRVIMYFDSAPERMRSLYHELEHVLDSVRANGATPAELERAATIQRRQVETALQDNRYWLNAIGLYHRLGIALDRIPHPYDTTPLTPDELRDAARRYLPPDVYIHLTAMPRDTTYGETRGGTQAPARLATRGGASRR
ncbi:MAG TPA: insulinase family protein [Gemmatimonadaceae bacterium]